MTARAPNPEILDHEYDGIHEYDNPIPGWWHAIFALTVIFSVVYYAFYHSGSPFAATIQDNWKSIQTAEFAKIFKDYGDLEPTPETMHQLMGDSRMMAVANGIFISNCAQCHAKDGGGINGVNLTDNSYKNVTKLEDFFSVITKGANAGAMPAWENRLNKNERVLMAAYAASLRGTTPANPRPAEGTELAPWPK